MNYPPQPYPSQPYPSQPYPPQPQPYPNQGYPPQPPYPNQGYPPQPPYPNQQPYVQQPPPYPPQQYQPYQGQQPVGQPFVIAVRGTGSAKFAPTRGLAITVTPDWFGMANNVNPGWRVGWQEIVGLVVTRAFHQSIALPRPKVWRVRLIIQARDDGFAARQPLLAKRADRTGATGPYQFGVPLGPVENIVPALDQAFATYGRGVYRGVVDEGQVIGFGYR